MVTVLDNGSLAVEGGIRITRRQCQVLELIAAGHTNEEIATRLEISAQTVKHHVSHLLCALSVSNRAMLASWWVEVDTRLQAATG